jgi:phosphoglycolate phosphatase-like HAD superfamily hydrolase
MVSVRIFTDFDGPIADLADRYYHVYRLCIAQTPRGDRQIKVFTKDDYWQLKRAKVSELEIAERSGFSSSQAELFKKLRDKLAHRAEYIQQFDGIIPGAIDGLEKVLAAGIELYTMTLRRETELDLTCQQYNLDRFFPIERRYCLLDGNIRTDDINLKTELMAAAINELPPCDVSWMIGDTETDILAAKSHNIPSIAVLSGIRDFDRLHPHQPDEILPTLADAIDFILLNIKP